MRAEPHSFHCTVITAQTPAPNDVTREKWRQFLFCGYFGLIFIQREEEEMHHPSTHMSVYQADPADIGANIAHAHTNAHRLSFTTISLPKGLVLTYTRTQIHTLIRSASHRRHSYLLFQLTCQSMIAKRWEESQRDLQHDRVRHACNIVEFNSIRIENGMLIQTDWFNTPKVTEF